MDGIQNQYEKQCEKCWRITMRKKITIKRSKTKWPPIKRNNKYQCWRITTNGFQKPTWEAGDKFRMQKDEESTNHNRKCCECWRITEVIHKSESTRRKVRMTIQKPMQRKNRPLQVGRSHRCRSTFWIPWFNWSTKHTKLVKTKVMTFPAYLGR